MTATYSSAHIRTVTYQVGHRERHRLLADAMKHRAQGVAPMDILDRLHLGGFTQNEAIESLTTIEEDLEEKRGVFEQGRSRAIRRGLLHIAAALAMMICCVLVGGIISLLVLTAVAVHKVIGVIKAHEQVFADFVLTNR